MYVCVKRIIPYPSSAQDDHCCLHLSHPFTWPRILSLSPVHCSGILASSCSAYVYIEMYLCTCAGFSMIFKMSNSFIAVGNLYMSKYVYMSIFHCRYSVCIKCFACLCDTGSFQQLSAMVFGEDFASKWTLGCMTSLNCSSAKSCKVSRNYIFAKFNMQGTSWNGVGFSFSINFSTQFNISSHSVSTCAIL